MRVRLSSGSTKPHLGCASLHSRHSRLDQITALDKQMNRALALRCTSTDLR